MKQDDKPELPDFMNPVESESAELHPREARFVEEYVIDLNATQAAIRAGYSERSAGQRGYELLRKPHIAAAIKAAMKERSARTGITADRVIQELALLGFADMGDFAQWDRGYVTLNNSTSLDETKRRAVIEVSENRNGVKIKLGDKKGALDLLGKHLGIYDEKPDPEAGKQNVVFYIPNNGR